MAGDLLKDARRMEGAAKRSEQAVSAETNRWTSEIPKRYVFRFMVCLPSTPGACKRTIKEAIAVGLAKPGLAKEPSMNQSVNQSDNQWPMGTMGH